MMLQIILKVRLHSNTGLLKIEMVRSLDGVAMISDMMRITNIVHHFSDHVGWIMSIKIATVKIATMDIERGMITC